MPPCGVSARRDAAYRPFMETNRAGQIAVIFSTKMTDADLAGYAAASGAMEALAAVQAGYCGIISTRGADGFGITVSYWNDEASATAWRDHPEHAAIRELGRSKWYQSYALDVTQVTRSYDWSRDE